MAGREAYRNKKLIKVECSKKNDKEMTGINRLRA